MKKLTHKEFLKLLEEKSISYKPLEKYKGNKVKISFLCEKHGEFKMRPNDLLSGHGCKECSKEIISHNFDDYNSSRAKKVKIKKGRKTSKEEADELLKEHNVDNQFSWDIDSYVDASTTIIFTCNKCGHKFPRKPTVFTHINNTCPSCNGKQNNRKLTTEEFIKRSKELFKRDDWSYEESEYKGTDELIRITCHKKDEFGDEHGIFEVTPHSHLGIMHVGCSKCSNKFHYDKDYLIKRCIKLYGDKYTYEHLTEFKNAFSDIFVTCPIHGDFKTKPNWILSGKGCPHCTQSSLELIIEKLLKDNDIEFEFQKKFDWLGKQSLDFYLPKYNIGIECQGEQHFKPIQFFNQRRSFEEMRELDEQKLRRCNENNVKLLYYTNLKEYQDNKIFLTETQLLKAIKEHD